MKFFKCHSQKLKDKKVICLENKFTDIGPDVFDGFAVEYIVLADTTQTIRNYAFSGVKQCNIYLPKTINEIEPFAFENMSPNTVFFCDKGSYAEHICIENNFIINYDTTEIFNLVEKQKKLVAEQQKLVEDQKHLVEEQKRLLEEQKKIIEEQKKKTEEEKLESARSEEKALLEIERKKQEEKKVQVAKKTITIHIFDDLKGVSSKSVTIAELPDAAKEKIINDELYMHFKYIGNNEKSSFISKLEFIELNKSGQENKTKKSTSILPDTDVTIFAIDDANGEKIQNIKYSNLTVNGKKMIVNNEVYMHRTLRDGQRINCYLTKSEYEKIKTNILAKLKTQPKVKAKEICQFCSNEILDSDTFCPFCGRKVKNVKICKTCGEPNELEDNFCSNCGNKM